MPDCPFCITAIEQGIQPDDHPPDQHPHVIQTWTESDGIPYWVPMGALVWITRGGGAAVYQGYSNGQEVK